MMDNQVTRRDAIKNIQTYLRKLEYMGNGSIPVPIDGIYDTVTAEAVRNFQIKNGILPTGIVNKNTWDMLYKQYQDRIADELEARGIFPFPDAPEDYVITLGTESRLVAIIQLLLDELEVKYDNLTDITIDGIYGNETANAVREFQRINYFEPTGEVDRQTWNRLVREYSNFQY